MFLPYATLHYVRTTGDFAVLSEIVSYLESPKLAPHEHERYEQPQITQQSGTLFDHCKRALMHGMRDGRHGLPLIGCGDWNDGMNKVGEGGEGESVWVAWFQIELCTEFAALMENIEQDEVFRSQLLHRVEKLQLAIDMHAWDGEWYKRAFMDDGSPLGSRSNDECQIDSIAQSWAVIVNGRTPRTELAFRAAVKELFLQEQRMLLLCWTWYTGSAAWMYRIAIENILGMRLVKNELSFYPVVPPSWPGFSITIRRNDTCWQVRITFADQSDSVERINSITLIEDGREHFFEMVIDRAQVAIVSARDLL